MTTTYLIDPRRPNGHPRTVRVDDTEQGEAFLAVLRGLYGDRLHPIEPPDPGWCRRCGKPREQWNPGDALYRVASGTCPDCHRADIHEDTTHRRQEDR